MTNNIATGNARNYGPPDLSYRLWLSDDIIPTNPNIFLVHGAVIAGQVREKPNNYFHQLCPLLHNELHHNVWEFEYADEPFYDLVKHEERYFNYGDLTKYGDRLKDAIRTVRKCNPDGGINIIAHSMGGLIARYAAQDGTADKIVTLDTGHFGFEMSEFFSIFVDTLPKDIRDNARCVDQTRPGSEFIYTLAKNFARDKVKLLSLAAGKPFLDVIVVVSLTSSSLVQVSDDGSVSYDPVNTPFVIVDDVNHLSIAEINDKKLPAFQLIAQFLNTGYVEPVSHPSGDPYFTVVLGRQPLLHYPTLLSKEYSHLQTTSYPIIHYTDTGHYAAIFKVLNVQADQDIRIEYAPKQCVQGRLTNWQSTIRTDVISN